MIIETDSYPCVGYQQQSYAVHQESGRYPPSSYHNNVPVMSMVPSVTTPQHSNHHMMVNGGGYAQPQEGWSSKDKHHRTGWQGTNDQYSYGYYSQSSMSNGGATSGGYGTYHDGHFPPAATKVQAVGYAYGGGWGGGDGAHSQVYDQQYPGKGYQKVEYYAVKGV